MAAARISTYGKDFARVYNRSWGGWTRNRAWPFVSGLVAERAGHARSWLDLCCGTGWLLKQVCESGLEAVGLDQSRYQLAHARRNAPAARLVRGDVRWFSLRRRFDVITCMFDSLNYLRRKNDLLRAFRNARRHLQPAGLFIFDMNTYEGLRRGWSRTSVTRGPLGTLIMETSFDPGRALGRALITGFVKAGKLYRRFQEEHVERGYRPREIEDLLGRAGFRFKKRDGTDFGRAKKRSPRLLYACTAK